MDRNTSKSKEIFLLPTSPKTSEVVCCERRSTRNYGLFSLRHPTCNNGYKCGGLALSVCKFGHLSALATQASLVLGLAAID